MRFYEKNIRRYALMNSLEKNLASATQTLETSLSCMIKCCISSDAETFNSGDGQSQFKYMGLRDSILKEPVKEILNSDLMHSA